MIALRAYRALSARFRPPGWSLAVLVVGLLCLGPASATAAEPSTIATNGASAFSYSDLRDAAPKYQGGYVSFDSTATSLYTNSPHGGYGTTTNKCRVCHAVHRAEGAYELMRSDNESAACAYCHIGGSAHSTKVVYDSNPMGEATDNGHRIGASSRIPLSATDMTVTTQTVPTTDASGVVSYVEVPVRQVGEPNRIFRLRRTHSMSPASDLRGGYQRLGPMPLTCVSCHTPHAAADQLWHPLAFANESTQLAGGYKLLRRSPSGSISGPDAMPYDTAPDPSGPSTVSYTTDGMIGYKAYGDFRATGYVNPGNVIAAPETTLVAGANYGPGKTIWTTPPLKPARETTPGVLRQAVDPATINQYALSAWCGDCHNLTIGAFGYGRFAELGMKPHEAGVTHAAPMPGAYNGPGQCYTCHRGDLTPKPGPDDVAFDPAASSCERCHYGTGSYAADPVRTSAAGSDWPHSAPAGSTKLLGAWTMDATTGVVASVTTVTADDVCMRCHKPGARTHGHMASGVASHVASGTLAYRATSDATQLVYGGQPCGQCHYLDVVQEHAKSSSRSAGAGCDACHPQPSDSIAVWTRTCQQGPCHPAFHAEFEAKHQRSVPSSCGGPGTWDSCHGSGGSASTNPNGLVGWGDMDAASAHADYYRSQSVGALDHADVYGPVPKDGCAVCHTGPDVLPAETDCDECHGPSTAWWTKHGF